MESLKKSRPQMVVVVGPFSGAAAGMIEAKEQAFVQEFVTPAAVEGST
jgi:hypothetical protein